MNGKHNLLILKLLSVKLLSKIMNIPREISISYYECLVNCASFGKTGDNCICRKLDQSGQKPIGTINLIIKILKQIKEYCWYYDTYLTPTLSVGIVTELLAVLLDPWSYED